MDPVRVAAARRGLRLEALSAAWMLVEAFVAVAAGVAARSVLLTAFGFDSAIELLSALVLVRRLSFEAGEATARDVARLEAATARLSAILLVLLCAYVVASSTAGLAFQVRPSGSVPGIVVAASAVLIMPLLAVRKARVNRVLESASLRADIAQSAACAFLGGVTLVGLVAGMIIGAWWAQYAAALVLLLWLIPEAREALEGAARAGSR
jgi:divalent metal cation (Fe/Co/Zn/Cd) transporter